MSKFTEFAQDIKQKKILSATIGLLNACPSRCVYCRKYTYPKDELDVCKLFNAIAYLKTQGLQTITFSGGDPLMYKHIVEVLQFCKILDIQTSMITTLIPIQHLEEIAKLCTRIHVSVDSAIVETYHKLRGVNALSRVKDNLIFVNSIRKSCNLAPVRISSVISNQNYDETLKLYEFARRTGSTINFYYVHTHDEYFLNDEQQQQLNEDLQCCKKYDEDYKISNAESLLNDSISPKAHCNSSYCKLPYITCEIAPDGLIYPCCNLYDENAEYGATAKNAYGTIYTNDLEKEFNKRFDIAYGLKYYCKSCVPHLIQHIDEVNRIIDDKAKLKLFI